MPPPKIRVRHSAVLAVKQAGETHLDRSLADVATAALLVGVRHVDELAAELAAMPPAKPEQDPETGIFKKSTVAH